MSFTSTPLSAVVRSVPRRDPLPVGFERQDIDFQVLDCCQTKGGRLDGVSRVHHNEVPVVRLYGVTKAGHSVLVHCYNFEPYLWVRAPQNWLPVYTQALVHELNQQLGMQTRTSSTVVRIESHKRQSVMYYCGGTLTEYLKIVVQLPQHIPSLRGLLSERGVSCPGAWNGVRVFPTFESNVIFPLRFLVDNNIGGCNWATVPAGTYRLVQTRTSTCQIEIACSCEVVKNHEPVGEYMNIAPFRILSLDIECKGRKGRFPEPEEDPVIQISCHCVTYGSKEALSKSVFTLQSCAPIAGADVFSFATEGEMLHAWVAYVKEIDPDILTGYNISNFDFPYLLNRASALRLSDAFYFWSRQIHERTVPREKKFQSKQMGNREYVEVNIEGRVVMDMLVVIQRDYKLRSYTLNSVSLHFLGEQKEDVHHSIIAELQDGTDETRRRLAVYCLKDAYLPVKLLDRLMVMVNSIEMARVTGVPIGWLLERGQQIKVFSQLLRKGQAKQLLVPTIEYNGGQDSRGYEGATVIDPTKGFYNCPIATLDFASLYPSIIMAHNLCYSTLLRAQDVHMLPADKVLRTPTGDVFVRKDVFPGVLPEILADLLVARKQAKEMMSKAAIDSLEYRVLNGRQLALKVSANSVYGFTGAQVGKLPCLEISASVTAYGREMIEQTKSLIESKYPDAKVVYGDTDSVMVKCATDEAAPDTDRLQAAMDFGREAAAVVSSEFTKPIKLEFEKVYFPFLLMNKKRYAGLLWTNTVKYDKLDAKGIETVRRDNCPLVSNVVSGVLNRILVHRSVESAVEFVKGTISDLMLNRLDISQLVITKAFTKSEEEYAATQAHVALVERMRQRDPASAPTIGDRVAYVIIRAAKGAKAYERSEDPIFVLENNIPIDTKYYLEHHLGPPILRVFDGVLADPTVLLKGDHTRHIAISAPSKSSGGLMGIVKIHLQCISCRAVIPKGALCTNESCMRAAPDVYGRIVAKRNHYEAIFSRVWTQCQQCQGSLNQEVICTSKDCPVFYMRKKVQQDLKEQQALIDRFGVVDDW